MKKTLSPISFCVGVYNEEKILLQNIDTIKKELNNLVGKGNYEIVVVDNGSTDKTKYLLKKIKDISIKTAFLNKKGLGLAYKYAIQQAKNEYIVLSAIDLPFGFKDIELAYQYWDNYALIFGSKAHPQSTIFIPIKRRLMSLVYRILLKIIFKIKIEDTQGSIFLKKSQILPILEFCDSPNDFFTAQLAIYSQRFDLNIKEIPVTMKKTKNRPSKINIIKDGTGMLVMVIREYILYKKRNRN